MTRSSFIFLTALATLQLSACGTGDARTAAAGPAMVTDITPVPVEIAFPERADLYATYRVSAALVSDDDAPVLSRVPGEVVEILVEEGDTVKRGDVLARLDGERLRLEMLSAKANLEQARRELARYEDLHARGLVSSSMFEGLRFDVNALEARYEIAALDYDYSRIRAPIDGVVAERMVKPGQNLRTGQPVFRITNTTRLLADLKIPQSELAKFHAGDDAELRVDAMPGLPFNAVIERISPTIDRESGTFRATAIVDNSDGLLAPGMFAKFTIAYEKHADAVTVPADALVVEDERSMVYVVRDDKVSQRLVTPGIADGGRIEIIDGLEVGEQIVVTGHGSIREGSKVLAQKAPAARLTG